MDFAVTPVPTERIAAANAALPRSGGDYVLYWMTSFRRLRWNFALQRAVEWANELRRPLLVFEALRAGYRWASDRLHRFILDGMADNQARARAFDVAYFPYLERVPDDGKGLLASLAKRACVVVGDDYPEFFLPHMVAAGARQAPVLLERVDSNGLVPIRAPGRSFTAARFFRKYVHEYLSDGVALPGAEPLSALRCRAAAEVPRDVVRRWPAAGLDEVDLAALPIDHGVPPSPLRGGPIAAEARLEKFRAHDLGRYAEDRDHPDEDATSGLSPYLHFGHLSAHQAYAAVTEDAKGDEKSAAAFLDQLVTWRELGFNFCAERDDYARYESLPPWARATLEKHATDERPALYSLAELERGETGDPLWNAAQHQLVLEGRIHNSMRMLWGKRVLEWTRSPWDALDILIELNNKHALDGRDPNSYSGVFWVFGRFDRPWPERRIFGKVRSMSSASTARKVRVKEYVRRYGQAR